jgi:hypothetical protein
MTDLDRKPPKTASSKKFQHVGHTIDTGKSVKEIQRQQEAKNYGK